MSIQSVYAIGDFQLANMWEFTMVTSFGFYPELTLLVKSFNFSTPSLTYETKNTGEKYYTGIETEKEITLTFWEKTDWTVYRVLKKLWSATYNDNTQTFRSYRTLPTFVPNPSYVQGYLNYSHGNAPTKGFKFVNMRIVKPIAEISGDYTSGDGLTHTATFLYDYYEDA
jgi:hypothetical protein